MTTRLGVRAILTVVPLLVFAAGCGGGAAPSIGTKSPLDTAYAYFQAFNEVNLTLVNAYKMPEGRTQDWGMDGAPPPGFFGNVSCTQVSQTATDAEVGCSVTVEEGWNGFTAGPQGWGLDMKRQGAGPWLIYDEGVG